MGSNTFGKIFRMTTFGESHGIAIGVVIDGCPSNLPLDASDINKDLKKRQGGTAYTTPRKEPDEAKIISGLFEGKTTGAPIAILIENKNVDSKKYEPIKNLLRPGHANFTYLEKYGIFDYRGGGRSSARETACRVAAGAIAKKILLLSNIDLVAYIYEVGGIGIKKTNHQDVKTIRTQKDKSPIQCPDEKASSSIMEAILKIKQEKDSLGGIIECMTTHLPTGLGDPVYEKLEANLSKAMMSLPATKGFEIGTGFAAAKMKGSEHNDTFTLNPSSHVETKTNVSGGTLGGISNGMPLVFRVAFKPTSSIEKKQETLDLEKKKKDFILPKGSRHDPCVTLRAVPIVEAMTALVLVDALLMHRSSKL